MIVVIITMMNVTKRVYIMNVRRIDGHERRVKELIKIIVVRLISSFIGEEWMHIEIEFVRWSVQSR